MPKYKVANVMGFCAAVLLHAGLAAWAIKPSDPLVIPQQVMRVSFVAPSSLPQEEKVKSEVEVVEKKVEPKVEPKVKKNALYKKKEKKKEKQKKIEKSEEETKAKMASNTSGKTAKDATEKHSAQTAPLFDAAYLNNPPPSYPDRARRQRIQGKVVLGVDVSREGLAKDVQIEHTSGSRLLDKAALSAVRGWRFVPAKRGREYVEARVLVPVEFKLN